MNSDRSWSIHSIMQFTSLLVDLKVTSVEIILQLSMYLVNFYPIFTIYVIIRIFYANINLYFYFIRSAIFFLAHANIDRIYAKWQFSHPHHLNSISGHQLTESGYIIHMDHDFRLTYYNVRAGDLLHTLDEPLCYSYDDIVFFKPKLKKAVERKISKYPKKLLKKYFPKFFDGQASYLNHDFYDMRSLSLIDQPLPSPLTLPKEFFERMGFNVTNGIAIQKKILKFVQDMNNYKKRS